MANKWLSHVKKTMKVMKRKGTYKKGMGLSQVIKEAKKSWHKRGGADPEDEVKEEDPKMTEPLSTDGGRRRKTRRHRGRKH